jgi:hypothetical protein
VPLQDEKEVERQLEHLAEHPSEARPDADQMLGRSAHSVASSEGA